jgi:hypothetical protein
MSDTGQNEKKLCFVIGPIGDVGTDIRQHADWLLDGIVEPVFAEHFSDFKLERADKIGEPGMITSQIITRLMDAPLVVADMSFHNANAFYELAIRHMVGLPTIHMIIQGAAIPFDVAPHRAIVFARAHYRDLMQARTDLRAAVEEAIKPSFQAENPITHARGRIELGRHASPETKVILERLDKIETAIAGRDAAVRALLTPPPDNPFYPMMRRNEVLLSLSDPSAGTRGFGIPPPGTALGKGSNPASPPNPAAYEQGGIPNDKRAESQDYAKHSGGSSATSKSE